MKAQLSCCWFSGSLLALWLVSGASGFAWADDPQRGAEVFQANCETCHGPQGHGDGPAGQVLDPQPKNLPELAARASDDYLFWRVSTGKPGTSMAPWAGILTGEQIWQAVAYIRTLK